MEIVWALQNLSLNQNELSMSSIQTTFTMRTTVWPTQLSAVLVLDYTKPERIHNSNYGNGVPAMFTS